MASAKRQFALIHVLHTGLRLVADVAFPPQCPSCRGAVSAAGNFCSHCFSQLRMISDPQCQCCGVPFMVTMEKEARCVDCLDRPPAFAMARAVMVYDRVSAPLISTLKFADQWAGIHRHSAMMAAAGAEVLQGADMLIPVPLHWRRLARRKFNQSALLAYGISRASQLPCMPHVLQRVRATKPQMTLDRAERASNVKRAFAVNAKLKHMVNGKTVVLVDDVVTTGETVSACSFALKAAGAVEVRVLALARTVKE